MPHVKKAIQLGEWMQTQQSAGNLIFIQHTEIHLDRQRYMRGVQLTNVGREVVAKAINKAVTAARHSALPKPKRFTSSQVTANVTFAQVNY